jgi:hypothetical protein
MGTANMGLDDLAISVSVPNLAVSRRLSAAYPDRTLKWPLG